MSGRHNEDGVDAMAARLLGHPAGRAAPSPPAPTNMDESWMDVLPTAKQARDYHHHGTFTPDPAGWTT